MATTPTVYVICDQNCKFEGMTKEQILTAIMQAVEGGEIKDVDTGFITTIKTINGTPLKFFVGEQAVYDELSDDDKQNLFAIITNDTTKEGLLQAIAELQEYCEGIEGGSIRSYAYMGVRSEANGRLLRGTDEEHLNIDSLCKPSQCGSYALLWSDVKNGFVDGLPSFEVTGGYAANLDVTCDYNDDSLPTVHQTLRCRTDITAENDIMLIFARYGVNGNWSAWKRFISAEEVVGTYRKIAEARQYIADLDAVIYDTGLGTQPRIDLSSRLLSGKTADDTIGISGRVMVTIGDKAAGVKFSLLWDSYNYTAGEISKIIYIGGAPYLLNMEISLNSSLSIWCTDCELIRLSDNGDVSSFEIKLKNLNVFYK